MTIVSSNTLPERGFARDALPRPRVELVPTFLRLVAISGITSGASWAAIRKPGDYPGTSESLTPSQAGWTWPGEEWSLLAPPTPGLWLPGDPVPLSVPLR